METITLEFQPNLKSKILELLSAFSKNEVRIVKESSAFEDDKAKLHAVSKKINNGTAKFYTFEELHAILEKTISKYEN